LKLFFPNILCKRPKVAQISQHQLLQVQTQQLKAFFGKKGI